MYRVLIAVNFNDQNDKKYVLIVNSKYEFSPFKLYEHSTHTIIIDQEFNTLEEARKYVEKNWHVKEVEFEDSPWIVWTEAAYMEIKQ